jgi:hypothetical protein
VAKINPNDVEAVTALHESLPEGWAVGPLRCPIGLDSSPIICSAGYCVACQWMREHWDQNPQVELLERT